ncbi:hypothetical protein [Chitinophaga sancti]|uniref:Uncharacterized protein n=1 Tax=Chitinophaga sancti TaxID=1004 RepID=A0A1K1SCY8_9BACT|nr:hypothetical protein [Chitinophaga sancti]WQD63570.1 hypothetical protein U0033_04120 [Chitinophaga sancti]WQG90804.1 hypothetical protein SR876_04795 [Chitinophaga sancti]SFW81781.1 hypothetical protein SAMN05661012_05141 [Chitinophaga sancti]
MRIIIATDTKDEIKTYLNNINHELTGRRLDLNEEKIKLFRNSSIVENFFKKTGNLIDDYETTIIDDNNEILSLQGAIEKSTLGLCGRNLKIELLQLIRYAIERKSGIVFFF